MSHHKEAKQGPCPFSLLAAFVPNYSNADGKSHQVISLPLDKHPIGTRDFTVAAWVKRAATKYMVIASQDRAGHAHPQFRLELDAKGHSSFVCADNATDDQTWPGFVSSAVLPEEWVHVAVTRRGNLHHMYHNAVQVAEFKSKSTINITHDAKSAIHFRVGSRHADGEKVDSCFHGHINAAVLTYAAASPCQIAAFAHTNAPAVFHVAQHSDTKKACGGALPTPIGTKPFTMSAWIKKHNVPGYCIIAAQDRAGYGAPQCRWEVNKDNKLEFVIADKANGVQTWPGFVSKNAIENEKWHHVAVTRNGTKHRMFLNHEQVAEFDSKSTIDVTYDSKDARAPQHFRVGARHPENGDDVASPFPGEIHDFKLILTALGH